MSPRDSLHRTWELIRHNTLLLLREPGPLLSRMILPLVFLALLRPLYVAAQGRVAGTELAVTGTLVTFSLLALSISGSTILTERLARTWDRLRATAVHPAELLTGKALPVFVVLLAQQVLILGFGIVVAHLSVPHPALLAAVLLAWTAMLLVLGALLGVVARSVGALAAAYDIGGLLLSSLGGALVPLTVLPRWVGDVAPASPGYWAVRGMHAALAGNAAATALACGVLAGLTVCLGMLTASRLHRQGGRLVALQ